MIPISSFDEITKDDIRLLIENQVSEGRTIDYKRTLPGGGDEDKREFLADVASFANSSGGDLLYGVTENGGVPTAADGLAGIDPDHERLRLDGTIRTGIAPRIPGVRIVAIDGFDQGPVILVRIPKSWASPHMVTFKNLSRFFVRTSAGKSQMDVDEIRQAFLLSESISDRIKAFRLDRLAQIAAGETPVPLPDNPKIVLHLLPLVAFTSTSFQIQPQAMREHRNDYMPLNGSADVGRFNVDGYVNIDHVDGQSDKRLGYCQLYRTGVIEMVDVRVLRRNAQERRSIPSLGLEEYVIQAMEGFLLAIRNLEVPFPAFVALALLGCKDYEMATPPRYFQHYSTPIDRDMISCETLVEDQDTPADQALHPLFDTIWNASGWDGSPNYDAHGRWKPHE